MGIGSALAEILTSHAAKKALESFMGGRKSAEEERIAAEAKVEREGVFTSVLDGVFTRMFPRLSALKEIANATGLRDSGPEAFSFQNELDTFLAVARFVPDSWLRHVTDILVDIPGFMTIVEHWPLLDPGKTVGIDMLSTDIVERVRSKEPTAVIDFLRVMSKDFATGKVTTEMIMEWLGVSSPSADPSKKDVS